MRQFHVVILLPMLCVLSVGAREAKSQTTWEVPGDDAHIKGAMALASAGDLILVTDTIDDTVLSVPIRMKAGVSIEVVPGEIATVYSALDTSITFPQQTYGSGTTTRVSGIRFTGSGSTGIKLKIMSGTGDVVIEGCTFENATFGIEGLIIGSGVTLAIRNNTFQTGYNGMWLQGAPYATTVERNVFDSCPGAGIILEAGAPLIQQNTIVDCGDGIVFGGFITPEPYLWNNLVVNCTDRGIGAMAVLALSYNNAYGNGTDYDASYGGGTPYGNFSQDPFFCASEFTVHVNSVCTPASNASGQRIGAMGIGCASGNLANTTTLSTSTVEGALVNVTSDFGVPSTKTLTINSGITLRFDTNDESNLGSDGSENELVVVGTLDVNGVNGTPVIFESAQGSPAEGDWWGLNAQDGYVTMEYATVRHSQYGAHMNVQGGSITNCTFASNQLQDIGV